MSTAPKFNFSNLDITEEEFKAAEEKKNYTPKFFSPGNYKLKIVGAEFNKISEADPTWFSVKITFGDTTGRTLKYYLSVPTSKIKYNEGKSKYPTFLFAQFKQFMAALGEEVTINKESLKAIPKYFNDCSVLVGKVVDVDVGYKGPYIKYISKDEYQIIERDGPMKDGDAIAVFPTRDAAEAEAAARDLKIAKFVDILKFNASEKAAGDEEGW
jgi:hypothetical protein